MKRQFDDKMLFEGVEDSLAYKTEAAVLEFTEELVARMKTLDVNRADLARKIGCSPAYVTKILRGSTNFTLETMVKIADVLGCKVRTHLQSDESSRRRQHGSNSSRGAMSNDEGCDVDEFDRLNDARITALEDGDFDQALIVHSILVHLGCVCGQEKSTTDCGG